MSSKPLEFNFAESAEDKKKKKNVFTILYFNKGLVIGSVYSEVGRRVVSRPHSE